MASHRAGPAHARMWGPATRKGVAMSVQGDRPDHHAAGRRWIWPLSVLCALLLGFAPGCFMGDCAQQASGLVVDDTGRPLPDVVVTLRPTRESDCREGPARYTTDEHGNFGLCLIYPPTVRKPSFELVFVKDSYETKRELLSKSKDGLIVMMKKGEKKRGK